MVCRHYARLERLALISLDRDFHLFLYTSLCKWQPDMLSIFLQILKCSYHQHQYTKL